MLAEGDVKHERIVKEKNAVIQLKVRRCCLADCLLDAHGIETSWTCLLSYGLILDMSISIGRRNSGAEVQNGRHV